jgi:hypothetical protein
MHEVASLEPGEGLDGFPELLLSEVAVRKGSKIQPRVRTRTKKMSQPKGRIARDGASPVQDLCDPIGRNVELARQRSRTRAERFQVFSQMLAAMDRGQHHNAP